VTEKDPEKEIEIARETETGGEHPPNHAAAHLRGNGHDLGQVLARAPAIALPASSTSTAMSHQQAVAVDLHVDGCDLQTGPIDQTGTTVDELTDISPVILLVPAANVTRETESRKKRGMFRKGEARIAVDDGNSE